MALTSEAQGLGAPRAPRGLVWVWSAVLGEGHGPRVTVLVGGPCVCEGEGPVCLPEWGEVGLAWRLPRALGARHGLDWPEKGLRRAS